MAEVIILSPIAKVIIERLGSAAVKQLGSMWGVKDDLEDLKNTLSTIQAVLLDAEKQQSHNNQVRLWLERLEVVVNDADDLVDDVATEGLRRQLRSGKEVVNKVRDFFSSSNQLFYWHKIANEIKVIRKKMAAIATDRRDFQLVENSEVEMARPMRRSWRETHSFVVVRNVVGRFWDKMEVVDLLLIPESMEHQERVSVVPIVGMGGIGKTTLAQLVFNHQLVKQHFEPRIWVCVSEDFDEKVLLRRIVESISDACTKDDTLEKLHTTFREKIDGKRYLLVLDDVWSEDGCAWQKVKDLLTNCGKSGSKIVVTTRSQKVAKLSSKTRPYHLGILDEDDSWSLFKKVTFTDEKGPIEPRTEEIGKEIVKKCGGIPLAIKMVAGMLSNRDPKVEWSSFLNKEFSRIPQQDDGILSTLRLSYNYLPSHLKHCYAYCSLFPKDHRIDVETLVTLWIAQGFIGVPLDESQSLEDVGYDYFLELVWKSFFQEVEIDEGKNKVIACKMHDLVHDLATQIAGKNYAILDGSKTNNFEKVRHVSLVLRTDVPPLLRHAKMVRTFIQPDTRYNFKKSESLGEVALNFRLLRMLDLHDSLIEEVPFSIGKLKQLRYLDLSQNHNIIRLPISITKLVNLQTLKLRGCTNLREFSIGIVKLVNLRHLTWSNNKLSLPRGASQLINLQTLSYFTLSDDPSHSKLEELIGLNNLRGNLKIRHIRSGMGINGAILQGKEYLHSLKLSWFDHDIHGASISVAQEREKTLEGLQPHQNLKALTIKWYDGIKFSNWFSSLKNLIELHLSHCLKLKHLSLLISLCSLKKLHVESCYEMEYIVTYVDGDSYIPSQTSLSPPIPIFPSLEHLIFRNLPNFKEWKFSIENEDEVPLMSYFPCLIFLTILGCPKLTYMPLYPNMMVLKLAMTNRKPFKQTMTSKIEWPQMSLATTTIDSSSSSSSSASSFYPLFKVTRLCLHCRSKICVQYLPAWMQSLCTLETLEIHELDTKKIHSQSFSFNGVSITWKFEKNDERELRIRRNHTSWEIFSNVRELILKGVPVLKYVSLASQYLISLETLEICDNDDFEFSYGGIDTSEWEHHTNLRIVRFVKLPNLVNLPEWLQHITILKELMIWGCDNLSVIPNWICKLSSLQQFQILCCKKMESMPASLSSLTSLQTLEFSSCPISFERSNDTLISHHEIIWKSLSSLHTLTLKQLPNLVNLPKELQYATTLQILKFYCCKNLVAIPDWIGNMSSLQELEISLCRKIELLPGSIKNLCSLQTLRINGCPVLSKRCRKQTGEDWPTICHIPNIDNQGEQQHSSTSAV